MPVALKNPAQDADEFVDPEVLDIAADLAPDLLAGWVPESHGVHDTCLRCDRSWERIAAEFAVKQDEDWLAWILAVLAGFTDAVDQLEYQGLSPTQIDASLHALGKLPRNRAAVLSSMVPCHRAATLELLIPEERLATMHEIAKKKAESWRRMSAGDKAKILSAMTPGERASMIEVTFLGGGGGGCSTCHPLQFA